MILYENVYVYAYVNVNGTAASNAMAFSNAKRLRLPDFRGDEMYFEFFVVEEEK
ncbi:MAG: hypothetical protein K9N48_07100 [Verrucomicrobia bacterium]|nr:hypothetical protein [Verrucomicrobiota bacterium]MCF7708989.1 hypothetical protein [Verrucomicrobiota bacterium]